MSPRIKCPPGCTCKRHSKVGNKCEPGCTCKRHSNTFSVVCKPGCTCSKHKKHPPNCACGAHNQSETAKANNAKSQRQRWQNATAEDREALGKKVAKTMADRGMVVRPDSTRAYHRNHMRVRSVRGVAKSQKCELCGNQGYEWSQIHGTDGTDPHKHFRALCHPCHTEYDRK